VIEYGRDYTDDDGEPLAEEQKQESILDRLRAALVDTDGLDKIPEPEPLIAGVLYCDSLAWIQGKSGDGKSFLAIDMGGSVGTGITWQGYPTTQGLVLYLAAEGAAGIKRRIRAWEESMGRAMNNVLFLPLAVQAGLDGEWQALRELVTELRPILVIIDTQARVTVGMEENAARDMGIFVHKLSQLRKSCGACILVVHHQGRNGDHMRGSTALYGSADTEIQVSKDDLDLTVKCGKQKDAEPFDDIRLRMVPTLDSVVLVPDAGRRTGQGSAALKLARTWWDLFEGDPVSATKLMNAADITDRTFYRHVRLLLKRGAATKEEVGRNAYYRLTRNPDEPDT